MNEKRSYIVSDFSKNVNTEIKRLEAQVELFWDEEASFYTQAIEDQKSIILEIGSGPGFLVKKLSKLFPNNTIHSLEIDPVLVKAQENLIDSENLKNVSIFQGSVIDNQLHDNHYHCIIMRLVLEHLPEPDKALSRIFKLLKNNGKLILIDNDFKYHLSVFPSIPELDDMYDAYCRMRISEGGNPYIGRQLPQLMACSGFQNIKLELISAHSSLKGDKLFLNSESSGISTVLVEKGFLDENTFNSLSRKWRSMLMEDNHLLFRPLFISIGTKSEEKIEGNIIRDNLLIKDSSKINVDERLLSGNMDEGINQILQEILRLNKSIDENESLLNLGLDSINVTELCDIFEKKWGIEISLVKIMEADTVKNLCNLIQIEIDNKSRIRDFEEGEI